MAKVVMRLALLSFFSCPVWLCKSSPVESCAVGDAECQIKSPHKSGDAMLQLQHKVNEEYSNGGFKEAGEVEARIGKRRAEEEKTAQIKILTGEENADIANKIMNIEDVGAEDDGAGDDYDYYAEHSNDAPDLAVHIQPAWAKMVKNFAPVNPDWVWELDGYVFDDKVVYTNIDGKDFKAYVGYPACSVPAGGFPGLIIMPGQGLRKIRHLFWVAMFASQGLVTFVPDVNKVGDMNGRAISDSKKFLETTEVYPVDTTRIHLLGYSAGAQGVLYNALDPELTKKFATFTVAAGIAPKHLKDHRSGINPLLLIQAQNDGMYGAKEQWDIVSGWAAEQAVVDNGQSKFLAYQDGSHQPMQQTNFFSEVLKFIKDPANYVVPAMPGSEFTSGSFAHSPVVELSETHGCYSNDEGIEPIIKMNLWAGNTGLGACLGACKQVKGCVAFDFLTKKVDGGMNCVLFSQSCTKPMHSGGSHWTWPGYDGPATSAYCSAR